MAGGGSSEIPEPPLNPPLFSRELEQMSYRKVSMTFPGLLNCDF